MLDTHIHRRPPRRIGSAVVTAMVLLASTQARADPAASDAQQLFEQARALMADGRYAEACPKLEDSLARDPGIGTEFNLARCYELQGRLATALAMYRRVIEESRAAGQSDRESVARTLTSELESRVPHLSVHVASPEDGLEIRLDGTRIARAHWPAPLEIDPGTHELEASAPECLPWKTLVRVLGEGATVSVDVPALLPRVMLAPLAPLPSLPTPARPIPDRSPSGRPQRIVALALGAAGLAGLVPGAALGLKAMSLESQAVPLCPGGQCTATGYSDRASSRSFGDASTVTFVVSGALLAAAGIVWLAAPGR